MNNFNDLGKRFGDYLKYKSLGINETAKILGFSGSQVSNIVNGKVFGTDKTFKILNEFKELSAEWLFTGKEPMLKTDDPGVSDKEINQSHLDTQNKLIQMQEKEILRLEKELAEMKYTQREPIVYSHVAESAPELMKKESK
ncbi:helix-turn-helix domain-containing protein [Flavobacterium geliluteum]|uniref:Helix-turn-helix transcriptional regulator n=1 Tax=Flavobacterium geliluteum TaxID=2816120 RepID=A0A940X532_9FLAO|nr:helix-turn-helix transcriptional regulator [Flavobacterium geliluteum]MBP4137418.1 helix-turn-helix transcriptional regulator [Flavobacterium geliluteum]